MTRPAQLVFSLALAAAGASALPAAELSYAGGSKRASAEPELQLGYTDLRLGIFSMPTKGNDNEAGVNNDSGSRISIMAIGPVCGIIPINCFTPSNSTGPGNRGPGAVSWAERDGWNWLGGLELSYNTWSLSSDTTTAPTVPEIDTTALAVTFHFFQLGFQVPCRCAGRIQYEIGPFLGLGTASVDYSNAAGTVSDSTNGLYAEYGLRMGAYYTFGMGFQIGAEARYTGTYVDASSNVPGANDVDAGVSGLNAGLILGYRL